MAASIRPLTLEQRREWTDLMQVESAYRDARERARGYQGGMYWKPVKGHEYLIRTLDSRGKQKSLGPRNPENEARYHAFHQGRTSALANLKGLEETLRYRARVARSHDLGRVPRLIAGVLRRLEQHPALHDRLRIVGTHALYAYEAAAGVQFETDVMATRDVDWLWDNRLVLGASDIPEGGFLALLKEVDASFERVESHPFSAVNRQGFHVDLIAPIPSPPHRPGIQRSLSPETGDLRVADIPGLEWIIASPRFETRAVDEHGYPVSIPTLDPRVFAIHKQWVASQKDRDPVKQERDLRQAVLVRQVVEAYLPAYPFRPDEPALSGLPETLRSQMEAIPSFEEGPCDPEEDDFPFSPLP